jgi:hypothetical protein
MASIVAGNLRRSDRTILLDFDYSSAVEQPRRIGSQFHTLPILHVPDVAMIKKQTNRHIPHAQQ